jgi:hypothetical protein
MPYWHALWLKEWFFHLLTYSLHGSVIRMPDHRFEVLRVTNKKSCACNIIIPQKVTFIFLITNTVTLAPVDIFL